MRVVRSLRRRGHGDCPFCQYKVAKRVEGEESCECDKCHQADATRMEEGNSSATSGKERQNEADLRQEHHRGRGVTIKAYPDVSQFWHYDPKEFLAQPVFSRDYPPLKP